MERGLSKQQEAVLIRARMEGGTCLSTTAYAALADFGGTQRESNEGSILASVGSVLRSLVELGLMAKSGPGEYQLTEEDFRVGQSLGGKYPIV
jgi:hypothetical protein